MPRQIFALAESLLMGMVALCVLFAGEAWATCYPDGAVAECSAGVCKGTKVCDTYWSDCRFSGASTEACSVCGRSGTRACSSEGELLPGSCSAYAAETCNNCDDNGNGQTDEGLTSGSCDPKGNGCWGTLTCITGGWRCIIPPERTVSCAVQCGASARRQCGADGSLGICVRDVPAAELCNGCDDDGDGLVDNAPGQGSDTLTMSCEGPNGFCAGSGRRCVGGRWSEQCTAPAETCNGMDDDCDGLFDEDGVCRAGSAACLCRPVSCAQLGKTCGTMPDGCGGTLYCGTCPGGQGCGASGTPNVCGYSSGCTPVAPSKACLGKNCGVVPDGCGGTYTCGSCTGYQSCGGGGTPNVCGCTPLTQATACSGKNCGTVSNGCGGTYTCGNCSGYNTCGGGGTANVCGCTPLTQATACMGKNCGTVPNGCGGMYSCGVCSGYNTCGGGGTANVCGCTPMPGFEACDGAECGSAPNGCGGTVSCGGCPGGGYCRAGVCSGGSDDF